LDVKNIFDLVPVELPEEITETLIEKNNIKIERIISSGQSSPEGFWYDQGTNEWVI
jgi:cupin 2 domain-containing protein